MRKLRLLGLELDVWQVSFCLLVLVHLATILVTFRDYGVTIDEPPQAEFGREIATWYSDGCQDDAFYERVKVLGLNLYGGLSDTILYTLTEFSPLERYDTHHLFFALMGLLASIAVYRLGCTIGSRATGFVAALFLVLIPRFYAHSFNNPKDIPLAVFYIWAIYLIVRCIQELPRLPARLVLATGLTIGMAMATRVGGLILLAYMGLFFTLRYAQIFTRGKEAYSGKILPRAFGQLAVIVVIAWSLMLVFWPGAHRSPITFPFYALRRFSHHGAPTFTTTFFEGARIEIERVPWYYAPKWFLLALPEFLYLGLVFGLVALVLKSIRKKFLLDLRSVELGWPLLMVSGFFPVIWLAILGTPLYDGMRHFLFVVPPIAALSGAGVVSLIRALQNHWGRWGIAVLTCALLMLTLWDMIRLHPNQVVYFNRAFAGGLPEASKSYPTDYWENSYKQGVRWLDGNYDWPDDRRLRLGASSDNVKYLLDNTRYEFIQVPDPDEMDIYLSTTREDGHRMVPGRIVHTIDADGVPLLYIVEPDSTWNEDPFFAEPVRRLLELGWRYGRANDFKHATKVYSNILRLGYVKPIIYGNLSEWHMRLGEYEQAEKYARKSVQLQGDAKSYFRLGLALASQNRLPEAKESYQQALSLQPDFVSALVNLGIVDYVLRDYVAAIRHFTKAVELSPTDNEAQLALGQALQMTGKVQQARQAYRRVLELDPGNSVATELLNEIGRPDDE